MSTNGCEMAVLFSACQILSKKKLRYKTYEFKATWRCAARLNVVNIKGIGNKKYSLLI